MDGGDPILVLERIEKSFGNVRAVDGLSLRILSGSLYGLLGPNGAGKTTTIRMIMRFFLPDSGRVLFKGRQLDREALRSIGYLPEDRGLYQKMRIDEQLAFLGSVRGVPHSVVHTRVTNWLRTLELEEMRGRKTEQLSRGAQQKLQIAAALIHDPVLVFLDEPFAGLDPANVERVKGIIRERRANGVTFVISTHLMDQVEELCDHVCLIHKGRTVIDGPTGEVRRSRRGQILHVSYKGLPAFPPKTLPGVEDVRARGDGFEIIPKHASALSDIIRALATDPNLRTLELRPPSMRELFLEATQ